MPIAPNFIERTLFLTLNQGPSPMLDIFGGPAFWVVETALKLDLFESLQAKTQTVEQLSHALDADPKGIGVLLGSLQSLGYISQRNGVYSNTRLTKKWLLPNGNVNLTSYYLFWGAMMRTVLPRLEESIRTGKSVDLYAWMESQPEVSRHFQEGLTQLARLVAKDVTRAMNVATQARRVLDLGGGHGEYAIALCKGRPDLTATIFDSEQALATGRVTVHAAGLPDRIATVAGNFFSDELPDGHDVALLFNIVHGFSPSENIDLLRKVKDALNPGGRVYILEQIHNSSPLPLSNTISNLLSVAYHHLIGGQIYTGDEISSWLDQAGFRGQTRKPILKASSVLFNAQC